MTEPKNCMDLVESEAGSCSKTGIMCAIDWNELLSAFCTACVYMCSYSFQAPSCPVSIGKNDIASEYPEAITFPPIETGGLVKIL